MVLLNSLCVLVTVLVPIDSFNLEGLRHNYLDSGTCNQLVKEHFELELIVGKQWRIFWAWNFEMSVFQGTCRHIVFKNATPTIINRIWNDMYEFMSTQPEWSSAKLLMTLAPSQEMLLFTDQSYLGRFDGVANVIRTTGTAPAEKNSVPLFNIQISLLENAGWLVVSDCNIGTTMLAARTDLLPVSSEEQISDIAASLDIGTGIRVCGSGDSDFPPQMNSPLEMNEVDY